MTEDATGRAPREIQKIKGRPEYWRGDCLISGLRFPFDCGDRAGYRTWRRISQARTGRKDCHRPSRQNRSGPGGRKEERRELEGPAVPTIETAEALDDFGLGAASLGVGEDALQAGLGMLEGRQDLAAEERDQGGREGGRRLPALPTGARFLDREDHLMVS